MRAYGVLLLVIAVALPAVAVPSGVEHYTTHATGYFNQDQHDDMIITSASGSAFLLLGTGSGYEWRQLQEQEQKPGESVKAPEGWPKGSSLYVRENGEGYEVFTRDTNGKVHRFTT